MIAFFIKWTVCLGILLAAYHLLLANEKMHRFNRFFLIAALVLGFAAPFININFVQQKVAVQPDSAAGFLINNQPVIHTETTFAIDEPTFGATDYLFAGYVLVTAILLFRFGRNLMRIATSIKKGERMKYRNRTLVLVEDDIIPHSFLNYIFLSREAYRSGQVEQQVLAHELVHVNQRHTLDILFIELLKTLLWFNPLLMLYKKAIQLNHEFLADDGAVAVDDNVKAYQYLLVSKCGINPAYKFTSNLNFSITQKRLTMMNRNTSTRRMMLRGIALSPVMIALVIFAGTKVEAVTAGLKPALTDTLPQKPQVKYPKPASKGPYVSKVDKNGKAVFYKYVADLTPEEKKKFRFPKPGSFIKPAKESPNARQLNSWTTKSIYGIWLDGKHIKNEELANYGIKDIVYYTSSALTKNAINYPKNYFQIDLYTEAGYNETFKNWKDRKSK